MAPTRSRGGKAKDKYYVNTTDSNTTSTSTDTSRGTTDNISVDSLDTETMRNLRGFGHHAKPHQFLTSTNIL